MTTYQWADGFRAPKGVKAEDVWKSLSRLPEPSPEQLLDASKSKKHVLHEHLWSEGDQVWAQRARLDACRHIIGHVHEVIERGGKTISVRAIEFVRPNGDGRWVTTQEIAHNAELLTAYLFEIERLHVQAASKMARIRELIGKDDDEIEGNAQS